MSDFKNFNGGRQNGNRAENSATSGGGSSGSGNSGSGNPTGNTASGGSGGAQQTANLAAAIAKAFNGRSEKDIWMTILAQAEQGKRDGTLTNADLDNFYNTVAPLVDGYKRQKLKGVIARLKEI